MNCTPKGTPKTAISLSALFLMTTLLFFGLSTLRGEFLSAIFKILSLASFGSALAVISRYLIFSYTYSANDLEFLIYRCSKTNSKIVCRLYYSDITNIEKASVFYQKTDKSYQKLYNYCASVSGKNAYALTYDIGGEICVLLFEPDIYFLNYLEKHTKNDIILP